MRGSELSAVGYRRDAMLASCRVYEPIDEYGIQDVELIEVHMALTVGAVNTHVTS